MKIRKKCAVLFLVVLTDLCLGAAAIGIWAHFFSPFGGEAGASSCVETENAPAQDAAADGAYGEPKTVALTFDDGPSADYTERLLDGLRERDVKASFFLIGECIEGNETIVKRMDEEGHLIGVHCLHHTDLTRETADCAREQLEETRTMIQAITGKTPEYVRPPFGNWNEKLRETIDMEPVFWNVDSVDWKLKNTAQIVQKVVKDTKNGDIILMHDEFRTSIEAALQIIDNLEANGYTFVTVDELSVD